MSAIVDAAAEEKKRAPRRRKPSGGSGRRRPAPKDDAAPADKAPREPREKTERPPRVPSAPFPADRIGKTNIGVVSAIVRRGRLRFGFINLGLEDTEGAPRVYFTFEGLDSEIFLRRGYQVEFTVTLDEKERTVASNIKLTETGKQQAVEKEAAIAQRKAERGDKPAEEKPKRERRERPEGERPPRRERAPREDKLVTVNFTCHGKSEKKALEVNLAASIGKLKGVAVTAFDAPVDYNVYHVTPAGNVFLTKAILNELTPNDTIHLGEPAPK